MKTYAVVYRFADTQAEQEFKKSALNTFRNVREKDTELFHYLGFASGKEPEVEDKLSGIVRHMGYSGILNNGDYVGVYFSADHDQDEIVRQMAYGKEEYIDNDVIPARRPEHINIITDLLDYDPVKNRSV